MVWLSDQNMSFLLKELTEPLQLSYLTFHMAVQSKCYLLHISRFTSNCKMFKKNSSPVLEANILVYLCAESSNPEMSMMWIFPYFFEPRILECLPSFTMLDYQVCCFNHLIKVITREVKTALEM